MNIKAHLNKQNERMNGNKKLDLNKNSNTEQNSNQNKKQEQRTDRTHKQPRKQKLNENTWARSKTQQPAITTLK